MEGLNVISNSTCIFNIVVLVHSLSVNQQRHLLYICLNEPCHNACLFVKPFRGNVAYHSQQCICLQLLNNIFRNGKKNLTFQAFSVFTL